MTTETHFGTYTRQELEEAIAEAIDQERSMRFAALLVWLQMGFPLGLAVGLVFG
jgi:hypothetical protein